MQEKERITRLKSDLATRLAHSTARINLLDTIRQREHKEATKEESALLDNNSSYQNLPATDDIIALMLEAKAKKRAQKHDSYSPVLLRSDDILNKCALKMKTTELMQKKQPFHYDCIIKKGAHCSAIQIDYDGIDLRVFYIDPGHDSSNTSFKNSVGGKDKKLFSYSGDIQTDMISCAVFGIQFLNNLSNLSQADRETLRGKFEILAPVFLKNIQGMSNLESYYKKNIENAGKTIDKKKQKTLQQHITDYSISVDVSQSGQSSARKMRNYVIDYKTHKYLNAAAETIEGLSGEEIERLLDARCNIHNKNTYSTTDNLPTWPEIIQAAISNTDPSILSDLSEFAVQKNAPSILIELLDAGAEPDLLTKEVKITPNAYITPTAWAIKNGQVLLIQKLLKKGLDANGSSMLNHNGLMTFDGLSQDTSYLNFALDQKMTREACEIVQLFVENGADIHNRNSSNQTPLHIAAANSNIWAVNYLLQIDETANETVNIVDQYGDTPLLLTSNAETASLLLAAGAKVETTNSSGQTALHRAANAELASVLLNAGVDVNKIDSNGRTALHENYDEEVISVLLNAGADVNKVDKKGQTALHIAKNAKIVVQLIKSGAKINAIDFNGNTPLHNHSDKEIIHQLAQHGADINAKNNQGDTPLHLLARSRTFASPQAAPMLLSAGANVNITNHEGQTALHTAMNPDVVSALLEAGTDVHIIDKKGQTALHTVDNAKIISMLVKSGANIHATDPEGNTPLHSAVKRKLASPHAPIDNIIALVNHDANINAKNLEGNTPLDIIMAIPNIFAKESNRLIKELIFAGADTQCIQAGVLSRKQLFDYFKQAMSSKNTHAVDNLLKLRASRGETISPPITNEDLFTAAANNTSMLEYLHQSFSNPGEKMAQFKETVNAIKKNNDDDCSNTATTSIKN